MAVDWMEMARALGRMTLAAVLAAPIAFHPLRYGRRKNKKKARDIAKAQILLAAAGTIMAVVIGDHMGRAFGLVGLGAFIRFRTPVRSTTDAAVLLLLIGVGMAVGHHHYSLSAVAIVFLFIVIALFEWFAPTKWKKAKGDTNPATRAGPESP